MNWMEMRDLFKQIYSRYGIFVDGLIKFIFSLVAVLIINSNMGAMTLLKNPVTFLGISLVCAVVPKNLMVLILALVIVAHGYAISMEIAGFLILVLLVMFLFYFRFSSGDGLVLILMPVLFMLHIPFAAPVAMGLLAGPFSVVSVTFGTVMYFLIHAIHGNFDKLTAITADGMENMTALAKDVFANQTMYVILVIFSIALIAVYVIHKLSVPYAWFIASGAGAFIQLIVMLVGKRSFGLDSVFSLATIILGNVAAVVVGCVITLLFHHVDYKKMQKVQFEDDEYYYYVKAVPKIVSDVQNNKAVKKKGKTNRHS